MCSHENENALQLSSGDAYMLELNVIPYGELNELMLFSVSGRCYVTFNSSSAEVSDPCSSHFQDNDVPE